MHTHRHHPQQMGHKELHRPYEGTHGAEVSWHTVVWVVLGSMMGVGLLSMPAAYQRLGWIPATACLAAFALAACYAGVLYARVMAELPWVSSFHELGHRLAGGWGVLLVACTAYVGSLRALCSLCALLPVAVHDSVALHGLGVQFLSPMLLGAGIFSAPIIMHLASTQALQQLFAEDSRPPMLLAGFAIACAVMPLSQLRRLADIGWIGATGSCLMVAAMAVLVYKLVMVDPAPEGGPSTHLLERQPLLVSTVGVMDIMFAFSGQVNWPRFLSAMGPQRSKFSISAAVALSLLTPIVFVVGAVGYERQGGHIDLTDPITKHLTPDRWAVLINAGVLVSALVAYVIDLNVAAQVLLELVHPERFKPSHGHTVGSHIHSPGTHIHSHHAHHHPRAHYRVAPETQPLLRDEQATHTEEPAAAPRDEETALVLEPAVQYIPPSTSAVQPPEPRTVSAAQKALGTGVVFPALEQELGIPGQGVVVARDQGSGQEMGEGEGADQGAGGVQASSMETVQERWQQAAAKVIEAKPQGESVSLQLHVEPEGMEEQGEAVGAVTRLVLHTEHAAGGHASGTAGARTPKVSQAKPPHTRDDSQDDWAARHPHNDVGTVRILWALTTISFILAAWMVGYIWPSFAELEGVIGSLAGTSSIFLLPALLALRLTRLPRHERLLCYVLCAASLGVTGLGLYASIVRLVQTNKTHS